MHSSSAGHTAVIHPSAQESLPRRHEELHKAYQALVHKWRSLNIERDELMLTVETLTTDQRALQSNFEQLCSELCEFKAVKKTAASRVRERLESQEQLVDPADLASVLDYVQALFDEGQYTQAAGLWAKTNFSGELPAKYYRLLALTLQE